MLRCFLVLFCWTQFQTQIFASDVVSFFFYDPQASVEVNVRAFSRWMASLPEDELDAATARFGLEFSSMKTALQWEAFSNEDCVKQWWFFDDQDARTKDALRKYFVQNIGKWQERSEEQKHIVLMMFTHDAAVVKCRLDHGCTGFEAEGLTPADASFKVKKGKVKFPAPAVLNFKIPNAEGEHRVRCVNGEWFEINITQGFAPIIKSFYSAELEIVEGNRTAITWVVLGVDSVMLDNGMGLKPGRWQVFVSPESSTQYTLSAANAYGGASQSLQVNVTPVVFAGMSVRFMGNGKIPSKQKQAIVQVKLFDQSGKERMVWEGGEGQAFGTDCTNCGPFIAKPASMIRFRELNAGRVELRLLNATETYAFLPEVILHFSNFGEFTVPFPPGSVQELHPGEVIEITW